MNDEFDMSKSETIDPFASYMKTLDENAKSMRAEQAAANIAVADEMMKNVSGLDAVENENFKTREGVSLKEIQDVDPQRASISKDLGTTPEKFVELNPRVATAISNPVVYSLSKGETKFLTAIEDNLKRVISEEGATTNWFTTEAEDESKPTPISAVLQKSVSDLAGGVVGDLISAVEIMGGDPTSLYEIKHSVDSWGNDYETMSKDWNWAQKMLAGGVSSGVMMLLAYGTGFMAARGLLAARLSPKMAQKAFEVLSLGLMGITSYGQSYVEAREKGMSIGSSFAHGSSQGGLEVFTELLNVKSVKDLYFANKPMLRDIANFMKKEVGTEELNSLLGGFESAVMMPDQTVAQFFDPANLAQLAVETAVQTVIGGGVQIGGARGLHALTTSDTMRFGDAIIELAKTQENVNLLRSMADYAQNSALAQRAPEQLAKVVAEVTKNDTPWAYVSHEALTPAIRDRIRAVAPNLDEAITKAVTLQEDLAMPIEAFAQIINDESVVETLNDHVKFDQNGITVSEAKQNLAVIAEQSKSEVARLIEEQKKAADGTSETQQIIDDLTPILRDTGTIIGQTAKDQAVLWGKFFTRLSGQFEKAGKTVSPMELYKKYRSKIVGPDTEMVRMDTFNRMSKASRGLASLLSEFDKKVNDKGSKWGQVQWLKDRVQEAVKTLPEGNEMRTQLENIKSRNSEEYRNKVEAILKSAQAEIQTGYSDKFNEGVLSGEGRFVAYHDKRVNSYQAKANKIADALESAGASVRVSESKISNSCYVTAYANDDLYEIRISDHALPSHYAQPDFNAYPSKRLESASFVGGDYLDAIYSACKALSLETPKTVLRAIKKRDDEWEEARRIKEENQRKTVDEIVEFVKKNAEFILSISSTRRGTLNRNYDYYPQSTDNKSRAIYRLVSKSGKTYRFSEEAEKVLDIPEAVSKYARNELALVALANKVSEGDIEYVQSIVADPDYYKIAPLVNYSNSGNATIDSFTQRVANILPQAVRDAMRQIAYNGSPYIFDKFSLDHIGSGEGAQAHGRGLYFSLNRNVAEGYKDVLTGSKDKFIDNFSVEGVPFVEYMNKLDKQDKLSQDKYAVMETFFVNLNRNYRDSKNFIEYVKENLDVFKDETVYHKDTYEFVKDLSERVDYVLENDVAHGGRVYEVSIPDDNVMIREEAKFSEQPEFVQTALKKLVKENFASKSSSYSVEYDKNSYEEFARRLIRFCNERDPDNKLGIAVDIRNYLRNPTMYGYSQKTKNSVMDSYVKTTKLSIDELRKYFSENGDGLTWISKESVSEFMDITAQIDSIVNVKEKTRSRSTIALNGKTGREIYNELAEAVGDEDATEMMSSYGVKGIRYTGRLDGECAVVWDEEAIKIIDFFEKHPEKLMEAKGEANVGAERGDIAGWWSKSSNTLGLTKHTNITTFAHESGHMFLNIYFEIARDADAPQSIKRDVATLLDWFGLKDLQQYFDLEAKGPDFVREYHEKFARGFEAYLREGKAPSKGLEDIFYKFKRWITDWYKDKTDKETIDNAQSDLTADVRAVMARMLASEEEIDRENKIRSFANLWQDRKNFPGNDEQYLDYIKLVKDSDLEARAMLTAAYMEELEFMTERKTVIMAELANKYNEEYNDAYEDSKERLLSNPLYKALERITKDEEAVSLKIATSEVSTLPENTVARLNALGVLSEDGMPLEAVSKQLGFEDPVEFINGMSKLQPLEQKAREMAEAQMTVDNEDIMTREGRDAVATAAVMNELAMKRAEKEYAIVKATKKTPELVSAAKLDAEESFGSMRIGSVKTGHYKQKANKASQNAVAAAAKGDTQAAADAKKAEVFSMAKAKKAADIINRKEKLVKLALRMKRKAKKLAQRRQLDSQFIDQVLSIMSHYTTRRNGKTVILGIENPSRRSFAEFKKAWTEKGVPLDAIDDTLFSGIKDIDDMTVDQFDTLADAVSILVTQGRRVSQISKENYKVNLQNTADEISLEIEDSHKELPTQVSRKGRIRRFLEGYTLGHRKFSSLIYELGGFKYGKFAEVTLTRLNNAAAREATMTQDFANKYWELVKNLKNLDEKALVKGINRPNGSKYSEMMTKRERIAIALNSGNAENKQRLEADGFDQLTIYNVFSTLTDDEIQFVQNAWDLIDQFWKPLADLELRTNGLEPKKVLPVPITVMSKNQQKIELKGGYYPIKYDSSMNTKAAEQEMKAYAESLFRGAVTSSATKQGHAKTRAEQTDMKLLLDPEVIGIHAQQVIHDLCYREALQDINKILRNDTVKNAIVSRKGAEWYSELGNSLMAIAMDGSTGAQVHDAMSNALGYLRGRMSASVMGLSVTTSLLQPLGLIQSAARIGPKAVLSGMLHAMNDRKSCYEMSEVMRNRRMTMNVEIRDVGRALSRTNNPKFGKAWTDSQKVIFSPITSIQQVVDVPTWYGAYDLARSEGKNEQDAIAFADQTVLDTQGSGDIKDMSRFHRDHPLMTMFYSYFSSTYQLLVESGKKNASKGALGATLFARDVVMLLAIPNIVTALFFGYLRGTEPPEDEAGWIKFILEQFGGAALNMFIGLRELSALINGYSYQGPAVARLIPDAQYLANAMLGDKDAFDKAMAVLPFVGDVTGIPTTQLARSLKGAKAYIDGETDMPTAVLFGKPTKEY